MILFLPFHVESSETQLDSKAGGKKQEEVFVGCETKMSKAGRGRGNVIKKEKNQGFQTLFLLYPLFRAIRYRCLMTQVFLIKAAAMEH